MLFTEKTFLEQNREKFQHFSSLESFHNILKNEDRKN